MKWFHHECAARHDPKLQILGSTHGAEGLGIYWGLLEEIGQHSDTFHLKVLGLYTEADKSFANLVENIEQSPTTPLGPNIDINKIPRLPMKILAKNLFTAPKTLTAVIATCVEIGLFDSQKWLAFNVLYSPSFEQRADDYTRRVQRKTGSVRTNSDQSPEHHRTYTGHNSDNHRTIAANLPADKETEQTEKEIERRTDEELLVSNTLHNNELSTGSNGHGDEREEYELLKQEPYLIELSDEGFRNYCGTFRSQLSNWNDDRPNKFEWIPSDSELHKLFFGGDQQHKLTMCYNAYKLLGEKIHYPELVLRALSLMLRASEKTRIANPFGWMWSCLHGNGDGTTPWAQLLTAEEESNIGSSLRHRIRAP
ncbi:MAG: DUF4373 domain-containing protein [Bacteroidota bacterium]